MKKFVAVIFIFSLSLSLSGCSSLSICGSIPSSPEKNESRESFDYRVCKVLECKTDGKVECSLETKRHQRELSWKRCLGKDLPEIATIGASRTAIIRDMTFSECWDKWE